MNDQGNAPKRSVDGVFPIGASAWRNLQAPALYEQAIRRGEGTLSSTGALVVDTGQHTGRSPKDKFIVRTPQSENRVWWSNNAGMTREAFELFKADMTAYAAGRDQFVQDLFAGADDDHRISVRVQTELAWHSLFIRNLLIRPDAANPPAEKPDLVIVDFPSFKVDPARYGVRSETLIACDFDKGLVLIAGTSYAGEMKKAVFTYLNYILPERGVMPMHCSANVGANGDTTVFFGLSGTGKTTLSATPDRTLIGDDEHGWGPGGVFNFEGGCYAKTIKLSAEAEPEIHAAANSFGTVLENVILAEDGDPDFDDGRKTENTRAAYPLSFIGNASDTGRAGHPKNIVMLTADAFGVLPPVAKLTPEQAVYHFLSGFTAKVAGTEKGVKDPEPTFSTCFGAPFMPRNPVEYGNLLRELIDRHEVDCWLVNTGWTGGPFGVGRRMPIQWTRTLLEAVLRGSLAEGPFRTDNYFGFQVPVAVDGVPRHTLDPYKTWQDKEAFHNQAKRLLEMFLANFKKFENLVDEDVLSASPRSTIVVG